MHLQAGLYDFMKTVNLYSTVQYAYMYDCTVLTSQTNLHPLSTACEIIFLQLEIEQLNMFTVEDVSPFCNDASSR